MAETAKPASAKPATKPDEDATTQPAKPAPSRAAPHAPEVSVGATVAPKAERRPSESTDPVVHKLLAEREIHARNLDALTVPVTEPVEQAESAIGEVDRRLADMGYVTEGGDTSHGAHRTAGVDDGASRAELAERRRAAVAGGDTASVEAIDEQLRERDDEKKK